MKQLNDIFKRPITKILIVVMLASLAVGTWMYYNFYESKIGKEQPIPFSHRVHVNNKNISCVICHEGAIQTSRAGVPPVETCMLCHEKIIVHHPEIQKLRAHYKNNEPIMWEKVNEMPDFVFFNHSLHTFRKIDCGECHGNVKHMDRVNLANKFEMGFCVECHKEEEASIDCFTCHR